MTTNQPFRRMFSETAMTLVLMLLRTATAWAETESVSYIDEDGNQQTVTATVLTSIGYGAFWGCSSLTSVTIPNSVTSIGARAFTDCSILTDVICMAQIVPQTESNAFDNTPTATATLHVPAGSIEAYKTTSPWSSFGSIVSLSGAAGDLNDDSKIDIADAVSVLDLMAEGKNDPAADLNGDGKVDIADFVSVLDLMAAQ